MEYIYGKIDQICFCRILGEENAQISYHKHFHTLRRVAMSFHFFVATFCSYDIVRGFCGLLSMFYHVLPFLEASL